MPQIGPIMWSFLYIYIIGGLFIFMVLFVFEVVVKGAIIKGEDGGGLAIKVWV